VANKTLRDYVGLATESDVRAMIAIDAQSVSSDKDHFISANLLGYYVLVNTWLLLFKEFTSNAWMEVLFHLKKFGVMATIRLFDEAASKLVREGHLGVLEASNSLPLAIMQEVACVIEHRNVPHFVGKNVGSDLAATTLQLFRYPKRFSPIRADVLETTCIQGFKQNQNRLKLLQRRSHPYWLVTEVREEIQHLLPWDRIIPIVAETKIGEIEFTTGVGLDARGTLGSKLVAMKQLLPDYFIPERAFTLNAFTDVFIEEGYDEEFGPKHIAEVRAVPKSYKAARIIAMEETYRQALAKRVFSILSEYLPPNLNIHDQVRNQEYARIGSVDGSLATLDLTSASDDIQVNLIYEVFPNEMVQLMNHVRPTHYRISDTEALLHSYMTMGNALTFILETILFAGIARVACRYSGEDPEKVSVYGDDIIIPTNAAVTAWDFLSMLGFRLNEAKSYWTVRTEEEPEKVLYRESCGEEYIDGKCVSSIYFPRFAVEGSLGKNPSVSRRTRHDAYTGELTDTTVRLVQLQHRLYSVCYDAAVFLAELIQEMHPKMTRSLGYDGSVVSDIWARVARPRKVSSPYSEVVRDVRVDPHHPVTKITKTYVTFKRAQGHEEEGYSTPIPRYPKLERKADYEDLYNLYRYNRFLREGPRYSDSFLRLLGVSDPDASYDEVFGKPEIGWILSIFVR
jgi:hypothetical protein